MYAEIWGIQLLNDESATGSHVRHVRHKHEHEQEQEHERKDVHTSDIRISISTGVSTRIYAGAVFLLSWIGFICLSVR